MNLFRKYEQHLAINYFHQRLYLESALQRCSYKKVFWKYTANLSENNHAEVWTPCWHLIVQIIETEKSVKYVQI